MAFKPFETEHLDEPLRFLVALLPGNSTQVEGKLDVFLKGEPGVEVAILGDETYFSMNPIQRFALIQDLSRSGGHKSPADPQKGRLSAAAGSDNGGEGIFLHGQVDVRQRKNSFAV